jgi:hypothetical protein
MAAAAAARFEIDLGAARRAGGVGDSVGGEKMTPTYHVMTHKDHYWGGPVTRGTDSAY